jgi:hypothetical protein
MNPRAAMECQIAAYRRMTGEQRLSIALQLHELACDIGRAGIHAQFPDADKEEVDRLLRERIEMSHRLKAQRRRG